MVSDRLFRTVLENVSDAVFMSDDDGALTFVCPNTHTIFGYSEVETARFGSVQTLLPNLDMDDARLDEEGYISNVELTVQVKCGEMRHLLVSVKRVDIEGGTKLYVCRDVTEKKQLESQLIQSQKMEALGTLVAGVAHEVNNPVTQFLLNLPALKEVWADVLPALESLEQQPEGRTYGRMSFSEIRIKVSMMLQNLEDGAQRIAKIVSGLKRFAGKSAISPDGELDLGLAIRNVEALIATTCRKSGVALVIGTSENLPPMRGDQQAAEQVILNLITNALEVSPKGSRVEIEATQRQNGEVVVLSVRDFGPGVDPAQGQSIFDPFVTSRRESGGTGLGLSVSQGLMRSMGGHLAYENLSGGGAVFRASFSRGKTAARKKILLIDDEAGARNFLAMLLSETFDVDVLEAGNGTEGVMALAEQHPDVLVLDLEMPGMDGLQVCQAIRNREEVISTRVLVLTGHPEDQRVREMHALGFHEIIGKPFDNNTLLETVGRLLET